MNLALRLLVACLVIVSPTLLYLGLLRGLERLRDDALLMRLAESDDAPQNVSSAAAEALDTGPIRADGRGSNAADDPVPAADSFVCSTCGESNMTGARYCHYCLGELNR